MTPSEAIDLEADNRRNGDMPMPHANPHSAPTSHIREAVPIQALSEVPQGCDLYLVPDDRNAPALRMGEFAIINPHACEFVSGALYLIRWQSGDGRECICEVVRRTFNGTDGKAFEGIMFCALNRPRSRRELDDWIQTRRPLHMSDGPLSPEHLDRYIRGRVVGVFRTDFNMTRATQ